LGGLLEGLEAGAEVIPLFKELCKTRPNCDVEKRSRR
jgi:hypothetical protein